MKLATICCVLAVCSIVCCAQSARNPELKLLAFGAQKADECQPQLDRIKLELAALPFPDGWTIGIACNNLSWDRALTRAGRPKTHTAFTSLKYKITVVNGEIFRSMQSAYRHTLKHELGHIFCDCADEGDAEVAGNAIKERDIVAKSDKPPAVTSAESNLSEPAIKLPVVNSFK